MRKVAVVTNGNYFAMLILRGLFDRPDLQLCVVQVTGDYTGNTGLRALWAVGRRTALPYTLYKIFSIIFFSLVGQVMRREFPCIGFLAAHKRVPYMVTVKVNTAEVKAFLDRECPDLLVSVSCPQRISNRLLRVPHRGAINIHSSLLPKYAGLAPYFWVLSNGESETGTTVHYMVNKFDQGRVLSHRRYAIKPGASAFSLFRVLAHLGADALNEGVDRALGGELGQEQDLEAGSYFSHPTMKSYRELRSRGHCLIRFRDLIDAVKGDANRAQ